MWKAGVHQLHSSPDSQVEEGRSTKAPPPIGATHLKNIPDATKLDSFKGHFTIFYLD